MRHGPRILIALLTALCLFPTSAWSQSVSPNSSHDNSDYRELLSQTAGVALERQLFLADVIGQGDWSYDVTTGTIGFGDSLRFRAELLGSESAGSGTWLWSWANHASNLPANITQAANRLRASGDAESIAVLRDAETPLNRVSGHELAMIAVGLGEGFAYYHGPYEGGAVLLLITDSNFPPLPDPEFARWASLLTQLTQVAELHHRTAYESLFQARGFDVVGNEGTLEATRDGVGTWTLEFDELGRLIDLHGTSL